MYLQRRYARKVFCLGEACKATNEAYVKSCDCMALVRDESRWSSASHSEGGPRHIGSPIVVLVIYEGLLGQDASNVTIHTLLGLEHFATGILGALDRPNAARLLTGLHKKVKIAIELICTDATANEL